METIENINYKNYEIEIWYDEDASYNDYEHLGTFYTNVPRYLNPDNHLMSELRDEDGLITDKSIVFLCVNAYIHSGVALSTSDGWPFNDKWDGGLGGIMAVNREDAKKWFGREATDDEIRQQLQFEVEGLDHFCRGDVYGFTITDDEGEFVNAVGGYVGDENYCIEEAKLFVDSCFEDKTSKTKNKLQEKVTDLRDEIGRLIDAKENQADEADAKGNHLVGEELDDDVLLLEDCVTKLNEIEELLKNVLP